MSKNTLYEIILFKHPHSDSMMAEEEKVYVEEFESLEEARDWAELKCKELPTKGKEVWGVYYVDEHE